MLTLNDGVLFRTKRFVPDYRYTSNFVSTLSVDEVVIVDVGTDRGAFLKAARDYCDRCFSPVTIGGKVRSPLEAEVLFREVGADKVLVHGGRRDLIRSVAGKWGNQAVTAGVDYSGNTDPVPLAVAAQEAGAGEILLTSIDRDGSLLGYDLESLKSVSRETNVPVVISGGCGGWRHMAEAFKAGASGAATSVIHHFPETSLTAFKRSLNEQGMEMRP